MDPSKVYFTWPDRGFAYVCAGCGACCRGLGIGFDAQTELAPVMARYPQLALFARGRGAAVTAFNPCGRCWFLDDGGLCRIETEAGRALKPASCRLFPFNRVFRLGDYTIVDYNSVVCPLQLAEDGAGVAHADVLADIAAVVDPAVVGTRLPGDDDGSVFVDRERAIAAACFESARRGEVDAALAAMTDDPAGTRTAVAAAVDAALASELDVADSATVSVALWLTPSMRFNELFGPRRYIDPTLLARQWLVWLHVLCAGSRLAGRPPTLQQATSCWSEAMPLAYAFARWAEVPWLQPGPLSLPADNKLAAQVRCFGEACTVNRSAKRSLGDIISAIAGDQPSHDRVLFLRALEPAFTTLHFGIPETKRNRRKKRRGRT